MKKILATAMTLALLFCGFLALHGTAQALTNKEYMELMRTSMDFSLVDNGLNEVWRNFMVVVTDEASKKALRVQQRAWLKDRDVQAKKLMRSGQAKDMAYAAITMDRIGELNALRDEFLQGNTVGTSWDGMQETPFGSGKGEAGTAASRPKPKIDKDGWEILD